MRRLRLPACLAALAMTLFASDWACAQPAALPAEINIEELRARAEKNDPQAQVTLGSLYQLGQSGLKADYKEAMKWFQRAAQQGDAGAMYRVGYMYFSGQGVSLNLNESVRWFKQSAQEGFAVAQFTLGTMYREGQGVPQNYSESLRWFYHAAEQGHAAAQHQVGVLIWHGKGAPQDYIEGCKWWYIAAANGSENAREAIQTIALPIMTREQMAEASQLAQAFKPQPARRLTDKSGPPAYYQELVTKANAGDPAAQYQLSLLLQTGAPTREDLMEARKWVVQAAQGGHAEAQHQLGSMYYLGQGGLLKDYVAAYKWLSLSVNHGRTNAVEGRDRVATAMTPQQLAEARLQIAAFKPAGKAASPPAAQAKAPPAAPPANATQPVQPLASSPVNPPVPQPAPLPVAEKAPPAPPKAAPQPSSATSSASPEQLRRDAEQGRPEAQLALGLLLLHGKGVPVNRAEAVQWLEKAANRNYAPAQYWLATTFDAARQTDRVKWLRRAADNGFGLAQFTIGQMYFSGQGVVQDVIEAYKWLHLASRQGNPAADAFLETVTPVMSAEQIEEAKRRAEEVAARLPAAPEK
jgi:uncharacterized protein